MEGLANNKVSNPDFRPTMSMVTIMFSIILVPIVFATSIVLLHAYTGGDQVHYHKLYEELQIASLQELPHLLKTIVSSVELVTGFVLWLGAKAGIPKNIYISFLNVILVVELYFLLRRYYVSWPIVCLFLTNYYLMVIMTAAERLKIAYIILILSLFFTGKIRKLLLLISPFAHLQSIIIIVSIYFSSLEKVAKDIFLRYCISKQALLSLLGSLFAGIIIVTTLYEGIWGKVSFYFKQGIKFSEFLQIAALFIIALLVTQHRVRMLLTFIPLSIVVLLFGGSQINILAVTSVLALLLTERRLNHPLIYTLLGYLSFKSILYVGRVFKYGDGFSHSASVLGWAF